MKGSIRKPFVVILLLLSSAQGYEYQMEFQSESILEDCASDSEHSIRNFYDLSKFSLRYLFEDSVVELGGQLVKIADVDKTDSVWLEVSVYKWIRGQWASTVFSYRSDFCRDLFSPLAPWYPHWTSHIYEEDRQCLYPKGSVWRHRELSERAIFNLTNRIPEGRYKVTFILSIITLKAEMRNYICVEMKGDLFRIEI